MHKRNVPDVGWVYEIMNIWKSYTGNNVNCRVKNYLKDDHRSYIRNLLVSSCEKKPWKKIQATCSPGKEGKAWKIWQSATLRSRVWIPYKPEFFCRLSFRNCISCVYNCDDLPSNNSSLHSTHVWFSYVHNFIIILSWVYNEPIQRPAPSWLVSLIGRALHRYRRGQGFESRTSLNFFSGFLFATA